MKKKKKQKVKNVHSFVIGCFFLCFFLCFARNEVGQEGMVLVLASEGKLEESKTSKVDETKPVLNAAIQDGILNIQAEDRDSGIKAIYVNGYEFTEFQNGALSIRLQRFDAGYEYFTIQAIDNAGNLSNRYKLENPYYSKETAEDEKSKSMVEQLPTDAIPSNPSDAVAYVTEHIKLKSVSDKNTETQDDKESQESTEKSKEFYTIQTKTDKVFYLIIDRAGEEETVYFLTEISENDLLNVTSDNREVLPQNSVALESAIPMADSELSNQEKEVENKEKETESMKNKNGTVGTEMDAIKETQKKTYLVIGVLALIGIGVGYYFKVVKKKKEKFIEEDEEEAEIVYEKEEEVVEVNEDDFFEQQDEEENEA